MPEISRFFGIIVTMYYNDHPPPHFHARYGNDAITYRLDLMTVMEGSLPPRAMGMVVEWAQAHRDELLADWELAESRQPLNPIEPLK
ncbi:MAG: DUF4160 domain-containing protein [Candidatus Sumerlaeaceae bacterium]|nr:DUF4160 domain-containing protein [Candidatus Sumerlaeaceae bacterium]